MATMATTSAVVTANATATARAATRNMCDTTPTTNAHVSVPVYIHIYTMWICLLGASFRRRPKLLDPKPICPLLAPSSHAALQSPAVSQLPGLYQSSCVNSVQELPCIAIAISFPCLSISPASSLVAFEVSERPSTSEGNEGGAVPATAGGGPASATANWRHSPRRRSQP